VHDILRLCIGSCSALSENLRRHWTKLHYTTICVVCQTFRQPKELDQTDQTDDEGLAAVVHPAFENGGDGEQEQSCADRDAETNRPEIPVEVMCDFIEST